MNNYITTITLKGDICDISGQAEYNTIHASVTKANNDANIKFHKSDNTEIKSSHIIIISSKGHEVYCGSYDDFDLEHLYVTGILSPRNLATYKKEYLQYQ